MNGFHLHYAELSMLSGIPCCKTWDAFPLFLLLLSPSPASNSIRGRTWSRCHQGLNTGTDVVARRCPSATLDQGVPDSIFVPASPGRVP